MEWIENIKTILEAICCFGVILTAIVALPVFKYKVGAEERKLYLENANKVREVLGYVFQSGRIDDSNLAKLGVALQEASLYLNKDIVEFIDEIHKSLIRLFVIQLKLDKLEVGDERTKLCDEMEKILNSMDNYSKESIAIYRKHIVHEPVDKIINVVKRLKESFKRGMNNE